MRTWVSQFAELWVLDTASIGYLHDIDINSATVKCNQSTIAYVRHVGLSCRRGQGRLETQLNQIPRCSLSRCYAKWISVSAAVFVWHLAILLGAGGTFPAVFGRARFRFLFWMSLPGSLLGITSLMSMPCGRKGDPVIAMFKFGARAFTPSAFGSSAHDLPCSYAQCLCYKTYPFNRC